MIKKYKMASFVQPTLLQHLSLSLFLLKEKVGETETKQKFFLSLEPPYSCDSIAL